MLDMPVHDGGRRAEAEIVAVLTTSSHSAVFSLSGQMTARTSSSRISAAVPGKVLKPAALSCARNDPIGRPSVAAP